MELRRWKFSKCVKPDLEEFLNCVKNKDENTNVNDLEKDKIWKELLPQLPLSYYDLEDSKLEKPFHDEIIHLDTDSEDVPVETSKYLKTDIAEVSVINLTLFENKDDVVNPNLQDYVEFFRECFTYDCLLQSDDIKKLSNDLNLISLKELFKILSETGSNKGLLNLGKSLCKHSVLAEEVARQYCSIILLNKLTNSEMSQQFKSIIKDFSEVYSDITIEEIFLALLKFDYKCGNMYQLLLNTLKENEKEKLIRDFVNSCNELEDFQLLLIQPLVNSIDDHSVKRRLINLLSISNEKFKTDKTFIKILIDLIKNLGKGFIDQEPILYDIIDKNRTLLKNTALKALNEWFKNYNQE